MRKLVRDAPAGANPESRLNRVEINAAARLLYKDSRNNR